MKSFASISVIRGLLPRRVVGGFAILAFAFATGCQTTSPEQQAQWSATGNAIASQAAAIALDEASARLRASRPPVTPDRFVRDNKAH